MQIINNDSCISALQLQDVSFTYAGALQPTIEHITFSVPVGSFMLLTGDTGSGKSTLFKLLKPEITPAGTSRGQIRIMGEDPQTFDPNKSATHIGYVFQNPDNQVVCDSVWHELAFGLENIGMSPDIMRRRIAETCYFFGIDSWFRDATDTLSGGRKQLLALASVLVMRPKVLLLDEPTSQLDPIAEKNFAHALFRANKELGCTICVATHNPRPLIEYADCAYTMTPTSNSIAQAYQDEILQSDSAQGDSKLSHKSSYTIKKVASLCEYSQCPQVVDVQHHKLHIQTVETKSKMTQPHCVARIREAWFGYKRGDWVIRGLDIDVNAGEIHALVGGNGCGKSTLLRLLAGTQRALRGHVYNEAYKHEVLLPQDPKAVLVCETVRDELLEWQQQGGFLDNDVDAMLEHIGLSAAAFQHPYDLSGGQQQLLAFAKLALMRPKLMLLDEPTKGLDVYTTRVMTDMILTAANSGTAVLMASHDLNVVKQLADTTSMMFDGELATTQPTREFFEGNVYYRP